jgi:hypothetical protein
MNSLKVSNFLNSVGGMGDEERPPLGEPSPELATLIWRVELEAVEAARGVRHLGQVCEICSYWYAP